MDTWADGQMERGRAGAARLWALLAVHEDICVTRVAPFHPVSNDVLHTHAPSTAPDRAGACAARAQTGRGVTSGANSSSQMVHGPVFFRTPRTTLPSFPRSLPFLT